MRNLKRFLLMSFLALGLASFSFAAGNENLSDVKKQLMVYHDSGQYYQNIATVVKEARAYLQFRLTQNQRAKQPQKLALVLDIDETSLSNYQDMVKLNFGGSLAQIKQLETQGKDTAIPSVLSLYQFARANNVAVFFITGRKEYERGITIQNLKQVGYRDWTGIYFEANNDTPRSAATYKAAIRKEIEAAGYDIAVNIGDQHSDLAGGYTDMGFKLPNPYYLIK